MSSLVTISATQRTPCRWVDRTTVLDATRDMRRLNLEETEMKPDLSSCSSTQVAFLMQATFNMAPTSEPSEMAESSNMLRWISVDQRGLSVGSGFFGICFNIMYEYRHSTTGNARRSSLEREEGVA